MNRQMVLDSTPVNSDIILTMGEQYIFFIEHVFYRTPVRVHNPNTSSIFFDRYPTDSKPF